MSDTSAERPGSDPTVPNPGNPYPDTDDVRRGPDVHPALLGLLPLLGRWRGTGKAVVDRGEDFDFAEEVRFAHDGRPVLSYVADAWRIDGEGRPVGPAERESGWWRPTSGDGFEVVLAGPGGVVGVYIGQIDGVKFELSSDAIARTATADPVTASHRLYGLVEGALLYAVDTAVGSSPLAPHHSARLERLWPSGRPDMGRPPGAS